DRGPRARVRVRGLPAHAEEHAAEARRVHARPASGDHGRAGDRREGAPLRRADAGDFEVTRRTVSGTNNTPLASRSGVDDASAAREVLFVPDTEQRPRDAYGRVIDYLRISVTDRCNLRCVYCMPLSKK